MGWSISKLNLGLLKINVLVPFDIGVVYINEINPIVMNGVLVPFDIGVVYIAKRMKQKNENSFSPLRYWGGLYHINGSKILFIMF